jgi:hypothetical protein
VFGVPDGGRGTQSCDFDGDGIPDDFRTTGVAWYYRSSLLDGRYVFLANSTVPAENVSLGIITDDGRCDAAAGEFVLITPSGAPFDIARPGDQVAVVGHPVSLQLAKTSGGETLSWAAANLPDGLYINEQTGLVSGAPARAGTNTVMFGADNGQGDDTVTRVFHWTVNPDVRTVPNIIGATRLEAADILFTAGLSLGNEHEVVDCASIGVVANQIPHAGSAAPVGSGVDFFLGVKPSGHMQCP